MELVFVLGLFVGLFVVWVLELNIDLPAALMIEFVVVVLTMFSFLIELWILVGLLTVGTFVFDACDLEFLSAFDKFLLLLSWIALIKISLIFGFLIKFSGYFHK